MPVAIRLTKMSSRLADGVVHYQLATNEAKIDLNACVGKQIELVFDGQISCANCARLTKKSWSQGFCYPCSQTLACCDLCIVRPETCHHHLGTCRQPDWGEANCFQPHIVYLANSSALKVGITRACNVPARWADQGALAALPILAVDTRLKSGQVESALKNFVGDKTNWRMMLKNETITLDLESEKQRLLAEIAEIIGQTKARVLSEPVVSLSYPVIQYPTTITSLNFDKTAHISGKLLGIKGQYLILSSGVLNVRKFSGYHIGFDAQ